MDGAARRRRDRRRHLPAHRNPLPPRHLEIRDRLHQRARIRVARPPEQRLRRASRFSSAITCAWMKTSSAVVGSSATISFGSAHTAREFMRVAVDALRGAGDADQLQPFDRAAARLRQADRQVRRHGLREVSAHGVERIHRGERVLEGGADLTAADAAHLLVAEIVDPLAVQQDLPADDPPRGSQKTADRRPRHRLAGPRFADDAQHLARGDLEGDVVERDQRAVPGRELGARFADLEERFGHQRSFGLSASRSQSPSRLTDSTVAMRARPGRS